MRKEKAIIGGNRDEQKTTIKQLLERYNDDSNRKIEKSLISEDSETTIKLDILDQTMKLSNKRYERKQNVTYKEPYISTRHYWRGNIK